MERTTVDDPSHTRAQDTAETTKTRVMETAAGVGRSLQSAPGELTALIRRHPIPALLIGLGVGFLLGRSLSLGWMTAPGRTAAETGSEAAEAGFPQAMIQCMRCGQMVRQADMVHHSTVCSGAGLPGHGGSPA
jgi:hypothetical protein